MTAAAAITSTPAAAEPTRRIPPGRPTASPRDPDPLVPLRPVPRPCHRRPPRGPRQRRHLPRRRLPPLPRPPPPRLPAPPPPRAPRPQPPLPPRRRQLRLLPRRAPPARARRDLLPDAAAAADLFDPVLSAAALGFSVPSLDDGCRRRVDEPTLFYMPHCEASLYDALLAANWESPAQLRRVCVLGNSFSRYALQAEENRVGPAAKAAHVLAVERFAWEERIDEAEAVDEADWFSCAFNETSWHFFEVDLAATMA